MWLFVVISVMAGLAALALARIRLNRQRSREVAFFHPFCLDMGGGERVLWAAVGAVQRQGLHAVVYSSVPDGLDRPAADEAERRVREMFGMHVSAAHLEIVRLRGKALVEPATYAGMRLWGQAIGSLLLAAEAVLRRAPPSRVVDSMGYAFSYAVFRAAGANVSAYVHYPAASDASAAPRHALHAIYTRVYAAGYSACGALVARPVMVNSSWTRDRMARLWRCDPVVVFPPCDTAALRRLDISRPRERMVLSVAQFRPEKDHRKQIDAMAIYQESAAHHQESAAHLVARLVMVGSCRHEADRALLDDLRDYARTKAVNVDFEVNAPLDRLRDLLARASVGIHTMWCEHFGIGVIELMAAGLITIAHNSGGPREDIIRRPAIEGFLADTAEEYAHFIKLALDDMTESDRSSIRSSARLAVSERFSEDTFSKNFLPCILP